MREEDCVVLLVDETPSLYTATAREDVARTQLNIEARVSIDTARRQHPCVGG